MWKDDNDKIFEIFIEFEKIKKVPTKCPVCGKNGAHLYMDIHNAKTRRGGLWIWCDECYIFSHSSIYVPEYWENCPLVEAEKLCAIPDYLNGIKEVIDALTNTLINSYLYEDGEKCKFDSF